VFSRSTSHFLQIGGNNPEREGIPEPDLVEPFGAFTSAFKQLDPVPQFKATGRGVSVCRAVHHKQLDPTPQFKATAKLAGFLEAAAQ